MIGQIFACHFGNTSEAFNERVSYCSVGAMVLLTVIAVTIAANDHPKWWRIAIPQAIFLALCPFWYVSAISGDCGENRADFSATAAIVAFLAFFTQVFLLYCHRHRIPSDAELDYAERELRFDKNSTHHNSKLPDWME